MERISIFNYEIFYLDYLEGNLNEEETAMLMNFLKEHPECRLEDDELPEVNATDKGISNEIKKQLKQTDEGSAVDHDNYEHFLIAKSENILDDSKLAEVDAFVSSNQLEKEERLIGLTYFKPDLSMSYKAKGSLKQKRTVVLWPYVAAAASVLLFFLLYDFGGTAEQNNKTFVADKVKEQTAPAVKDDQNGQVKNDKVLSEETAPFIAEPDSSDELPVHTNTPTSPNRHNIAIDEQLPTRQLLSFAHDKKLEPVTPLLKTEDPHQEELTFERDMAYTGFQDIANPIEPITKILSDKTKRDIDFRAGRSNVNRSKGFYLKVGKFEISRRKH